MYLGLGTPDVEVIAEGRKVSDEIIAAPQSTCVDVVPDKDPRDSLSSYRGNLSIGLRHKVNKGPEENLLSLEVTSLVPPVVGRIAFNDGDVGGEAEMFSRHTPERIWVGPRLDNSTSTAFLGPSDAILGHTVGLRHARSGRR